MQAGDLQFYQNRALFYGGRLVNSALQVGENYDRMKKSIVISITKGRLFPSLEDCHNIFEVRDRKRGLLLCDRLELHFLELCKIDDQKPVHALTEIERLGAYLKFANIENRQDYVKQILTMEDIDMTENAYRKVTEDEREYERREARFKYQLQRNPELYVARNEGLEQGRNEGEAIGLKKGRSEGEAIGLKKGRSEGAAQEKREIAKNFKHAGIPIAVIAENTGLTAEEIERL